MAQASGGQLLGAAAIVSVAVIAAGVILANSVDQLTQQVDRAGGRLDEMRAALADAKGALGNQRAAPAQAARRGPDPNKRYTVSTSGAPARGPASAAVTIVEFSDFQ